MVPGDEQAEYVAAQERRGRELARRLADNADDIAVTLDRMAAFHEQVARDPGHPLAQQAAEAAAAERRMADRERDAARRYRRAVADQAHENDGGEADQSAG